MTLISYFNSVLPNLLGAIAMTPLVIFLFLLSGLVVKALNPEGRRVNTKKVTKSGKMLQSGVDSMQGKNTGNMPSAVCALSMNKSIDPTPI